MPKNTIFNFTSREIEQDLINKLKVESIEIFGTNIWYIKRDSVDENTLLGEDLFQEFKDAFQLVVYPEQVENFGGDKEFLSKFGFSLNDHSTFLLAKDEFTTITQLEQPLAGDLIFWPETKRLFKITFIDYDNQFYQLGKNYVWKISAELMSYSQENIETGIAEIDEFKTEFFNPTDTDADPQADNTEITNQSSPIISEDNTDFDPANPFQSNF